LAKLGVGSYVEQQLVHGDEEEQTSAILEARTKMMEGSRRRWSNDQTPV